MWCSYVGCGQWETLLRWRLDTYRYDYFVDARVETYLQVAATVLVPIVFIHMFSREGTSPS